MTTRRAFNPRRRSSGRTLTARRSTSPRLVSLLTRTGTTLEFRVARKLDSPNLWRAHWSLGHNLMKWWLRAFTNALATDAGFGSLARFQSEGHLPHRPAVKMRVTVTRQVSSRRNFLRDDDDLRYTTKPLNDALKHAGLIFDDGREWLEQSMPVQEVSPDGHDWTIVRIEPVDGLGDRVPPDVAQALERDFGLLPPGALR